MEKERKKRKMSFTTVGGSSILTIFAVLCFVVFALLSLSTATANASLTTKSTESVTQYYRADTKAEGILAELRAGHEPEGVTIYKATTSKSGVKSIIAEGVGYVDWDEYASFSVRIDENQELQAEVLLRFGKGEEAGYRIERWQKVYTGDWKPDDSMPVFGGDGSTELPGMTTIEE
ncbi:MAG: hypothetical protein IJ807_00630 [Eubacterium sp.]|nr:hypothetical protein [Eubacterium sp.]